MLTDVICGFNAVAAVFDRRPDEVQRLFYTEPARHLVGAFCSAMAERRRPYRLLPDDEMAKAAATEHHGGVAAVVNRRPFGMMDFVRPPRHDLLLILDGVGNPHNFGAIARSAAFFGVRALVLNESSGTATVSNAAYRIAEGGLEYLDLYRTRDIAKLLQALDPFYRTVAATLRPEAAPLQNLPRDRPVALVLGNEERGVSNQTLSQCRREVRILGATRGPVQSLNVAQAASVLLYELCNQVVRPRALPLDPAGA